MFPFVPDRAAERRHCNLAVPRRSYGAEARRFWNRLLFRPPSRFEGLPRRGFEVFGIEDHDERRREIIAVIHPALERLADDLLEELDTDEERPLHRHLPRLDWPRGYRPFCTWLALSREEHGYQAGPQLNVGVHTDHVAVRLGWDAAADAFGRFEFLARHGPLGRELVRLAAGHDMRFRVFAAAPWPRGSTRVFESGTDLAGSFDEVRRRGVWWELGRRHEIPGELDFVCSPALAAEAAELFAALLPLC